MRNPHAFKISQRAMLSEAQIFGYSLNSWPLTLQFAFAGVGIIVSFMIPGFAHKHLHADFGFDEPAFYTFLHVFGVSVTCIPFLFHIIFSRRPLSGPISVYILASSLLVLSMVLDHSAVFRLSHATEVLFKSPKLLPVMVGNFVLLQRRFTLVEVITICVIVSGFVGVALAFFRGRNEFEWSGLAAIFGSLALEAIVVNLEEKLLSDWKVPQREVMAMIFPVASLMSACMALFSRQFDTATEKVIANPVSLFYILIYAVFGAVGLNFVFFSVTKFGSLQTVLFTSLRKSLGGLISSGMGYDFQFTRWHGISWIILGSGLVVNFWSKVTERKDVVEVHSQGLLSGDAAGGFKPASAGEDFSQ